ncbi:MAG: PHP domain-containing protein [Deltaproteobacteria bacterium]|nr:PHP domain-containing protein [Deltaproteobacteria bacterium]
MRTRTRSFPRRRLLPAVGLAAVAWSTNAAAAPLVKEGDIPNDGLDHFFVDFDVPPGTKEIEIKHEDLSDTNILDFGLYDTKGYRGWGGGTSENTIVGEQAASRAYVAGPIEPGTWRVVVGKAKVVASPAKYRLEIELRTAPTLPPSTRVPYVAPPPRTSETRYYAGDFHVHSRESTDAKPSLAENIALAKSRGLDFIEISDHNTITQMDFFDAEQKKEPSFLLLPGIEYTTYKGHANAIGATAWVDHKIGQPGVTIGAAVDAVRAQGAIFSINHPVLDLTDICIGCAWQHDVDPSKIGGVEIGTVPLSKGAAIFSARAIAFWDAILDKGFHVAPLGGSDDHRAGKIDGAVQGAIGGPTTLVRARELSVAGILEGVRKAATVVKLEGPEDPMVELEAAPARGAPAVAFAGDTVSVRSIVLRARVTGGNGQLVRFLENGKPVGEPVAVTSDPFVYEQIVSAREGGEIRWRAEALVEEKPRTVTSHIWLKLDPSGPVASEPEASDDGGCTTASTGSTPRSRPEAPIAVASVVLGAIAWLRRRRG